MTGTTPFDNELSVAIWRNKYRYAPTDAAAESSIEDSWRRVARAVASVETRSHGDWADAYFQSLNRFEFLPAGRILASAGTAYEATLFNCFVMGAIDDSLAGIFERLRESALTMQQGGGIGCDFSTLRPAGSKAFASGRKASGPVSFMRLWNAMCTTLLSGGNRRGAMMGILRCDHPDIVDFIEAKRGSGELTNFNLSVAVTDAFMQAVAADSEWRLRFPSGDSGSDDAVGTRPIPARDGQTLRPGEATVGARELWDRMIEAAFATAEPGVLFIDRVNELNNLYYCEQIAATNPCGEVPLPPFGACDLGSINLAALVDAPFSARARIDFDRIGRLARVATRFLDDVIDLSSFPLAAQAAEARRTRRIGLGITGLADALIMLGLRYDSDAGRTMARDILRRIRDEAYRTSIELAAEKGCFPCFDRDAYLAGRYVRSLPDEIRDGIARDGLRNSHLLAVAPAGSISLLANNTSSGIEPVFALEMDRSVLDQNGTPVVHRTEDHAYSVWKNGATRSERLTHAFVTAREISPNDHLRMVAELQPLIDSSISKTVNVAQDVSSEDFAAIFSRAYDSGLKGCTVYRETAVRGAVLRDSDAAGLAHCCVPEREGD